MCLQYNLNAFARDHHFGGESWNRALKKKVQEELIKLINGYVDIPPIEEYIVTPKLADDAGTIGGLALAKDVVDTALEN